MFGDNGNVPEKIIISDESGVYGNDSETKQQSLQWKLPSEPQAKKLNKVGVISNQCYFFLR